MRRRYSPNEGELLASPRETREILRERSNLDRERDLNLRSAFAQDWRDDFERSSDRE